jgi:hypothetical protein
VFDFPETIWRGEKDRGTVRCLIQWQCQEDCEASVEDKCVLRGGEMIQTGEKPN